MEDNRKFNLFRDNIVWQSENSDRSSWFCVLLSVFALKSVSGGFSGNKDKQSKD